MDNLRRYIVGGIIGALLEYNYRVESIQIVHIIILLLCVYMIVDILRNEYAENKYEK